MGYELVWREGVHYAMRDGAAYNVIREVPGVPVMSVGSVNFTVLPENLLLAVMADRYAVLAENGDPTLAAVAAHLREAQRTLSTFIATASTNRLFWVDDCDGWGFSISVVRAPSRDEACRLAGASPTSDRVEVVELSATGEPRVLQCHDESPDTPRE